LYNGFGRVYKRNLRKKASEKFGLKKGSISRAVEEALRSWLKK